MKPMLSDCRACRRYKEDDVLACGIGPELAEFVSAFIQSPERYLAMTPEKRRDSENQMDAILALFEQR
jgi:hypothetical protein